MNRTNVIAAVVALVISLLVVNFAPQKGGDSAVKEPVQARILESGKIRCAYALRPPGLIKDMETGKLTGFGYDIMMEAANRLSLEVEWAEETGFGTIVDSIKTGRVDMACGVYWPNAPRSRHISFTAPIMYETVYVYQRADDTRTFSNYEELNDAKYSFSAIDGGTPIILRNRHFPNAQEKTLPELAGLGDMFEDMVSGKVDFVINPDMMARDYEVARPNSLKRILPDKPLAYYPVVMMLPSAETQLKMMLDTTFQEMEFDGTILNYLRKHKVDDVMRLNPTPVDAPTN